MKDKVPFIWRGKHHGYIGAWFVAFGLFFYYMDYHDPESILWLWRIFIGLGFYMIVDDIIEHTITKSTPLRVFYEKFIQPYIKRKK